MLSYTSPTLDPESATSAEYALGPGSIFCQTSQLLPAVLEVNTVMFARLVSWKGVEKTSVPPFGPAAIVLPSHVPPASARKSACWVSLHT